MTDEMRAELRAGIDAVVRAASSDVDRVHATNSPIRSPQDNIIGQVVAVRVHTRTIDGTKVPPLTTAQQLALSVLLGEPDAATTAALCDLLIEQGHEYAVAVAEKARAEEREQCAIAAMMFTLTRADELRAGLHNPLYSTEAVALDDHADWLRDRMMERA